MGEYVCVTSSFLFTSYYYPTASTSAFRIRLATATFSYFAKIESTPFPEASKVKFEASSCEIEASRMKTEAGKTQIEAGENETETSSCQIETGENEIEASSCETEAGNNGIEAGKSSLDAGRNFMKLDNVHLMLEK